MNYEVIFQLDGSRERAEVLAPCSGEVQLELEKNHRKPVVILQVNRRPSELADRRTLAT